MSHREPRAEYCCRAFHGPPWPCCQLPWLVRSPREVIAQPPTPSKSERAKEMKAMATGGTGGHQSVPLTQIRKRARGGGDAVATGVPGMVPHAP